jgi:hypothetical protein
VDGAGGGYASACVGVIVRCGAGIAGVTVNAGLVVSDGVAGGADCLPVFINANTKANNVTRVATKMRNWICLRYKFFPRLVQPTIPAWLAGLEDLEWVRGYAVR